MKSLVFASIACGTAWRRAICRLASVSCPTLPSGPPLTRISTTPHPITLTLGGFAPSSHSSIHPAIIPNVQEDRRPHQGLVAVRDSARAAVQLVRDLVFAFGFAPIFGLPLSWWFCPNPWLTFFEKSPTNQFRSTILWLAPNTSKERITPHF